LDYSIFFIQTSCVNFFYINITDFLSKQVVLWSFFALLLIFSYYQPGFITGKVCSWILSWGARPPRRRLATAEALCRASWCEVLCVGKGFGFNHKIMINVQESPPSIMVTRNLWSARVWVRDWLCKGKTHHPQCTLPKVSYIVVWLFFPTSGFYSLVFSKVQGRSFFLRKSLSYLVKS
jgi:hypothetical protein